MVVDVSAGETAGTVVSMGRARCLHRHVEAAVEAAEGLGALMGAPTVVVA
jgi:hypothetical protein